jgi:hypothetical protein
MKLVHQSTFRLLTLLTLSACSAESIADGGEGSAAGEVDTLPSSAAFQETLAELTIGDQALSFLRWSDGSASVLVLRSSGPSMQGNLADEVERLAGQPLTFLELYRALAPADEDAPSELLEAHHEQALALGRDGDEVVQLAATLDKLTPPPGVHPCSIPLTFPQAFIWVDRHDLARQGPAYQCTGPSGQDDLGSPERESCTEATTLRQRAGVCKTTEGNLVAAAGFGVVGRSLVLTSSVTVPQGQYTYWEFTPSATSRRLAAVGLSTQGTYELRVGTALPNIR